LAGGVAIQPTLARAEFDVVLHREVERARRAPAMLFGVVRLVVAQRHALVREVRDAQRDAFQLAADAVELDFRGLQLVAEARDFREQRRDVLTLGLRLADRLAARVAQVLQLLRAHLDALALGFELFDVGDGQVHAARGLQACGEFGGLGAQQMGVEHVAAKAIRYGG
jgi:hypothetical protein